MDDSSLPEPDTCVHNLHREPFGSSRKHAEPTDLCRSPIGLVHMVDCPLTLGRPCTFYEASSGEVEALSDDEVVHQRTLLHADFMRWSYRRRVHALREPVGFLPEVRAVEIVPDPEIEPGADLIFSRVEETFEPEPEPVPVATTAEGTPEERYPGQRRSEDRRVRPARGAHEHRSAAPAAHCCDDEPERDEFPEVGAAPTLPKTIDELFAALPEAVLPDKPGDRERRPRRRRSRSGANAGPAGAPHEAGASGPTPPSRRREGADRGPDAGGQGARRGRRPRRGAAGAPAEGAPRVPAVERPRSEGEGVDAGGEGGNQKRRRRRRRPPRPGGPPGAAPAP